MQSKSAVHIVIELFVCDAGNEIARVECGHFEGLRALRELVLDRNRIAGIGEGAFAGNAQLVELHVEENRLRDLSNIAVADRMQRLFLGFNRIQVLIFVLLIKYHTRALQMSACTKVITQKKRNRRITKN